MSQPENPRREFSDQISFEIDVPKLVSHLNKKRRVPLFGEITEKKVKDILPVLLHLDHDKIEPSTLLIDTLGGDISPSYFLMDIINSLDSPVDGLVIGEAYSMGADVLQMCRKRQMLPNAQLGCHFTRHWFQMVAYSEEFGEEEILVMRQKLLASKNRREELYARRTCKSVKEVRRMFEIGEMYKYRMMATEALREHLIDEIVTDFKFFPGRGIDLDQDDGS